MRPILMLALAATALQVSAAPRSDKDTFENTRYQESEAEKSAREFKEADVALPAFPDTKNGGWFDIDAGNAFDKRPKILLESIGRAPDGTVRYVLNVQSKQGHDNLTAEGIYCASSSFGGENKRSAYKVFGYGDPVNQRWIAPSKGSWKNIGSILSGADPIRGPLFRAFCEDGTPSGGPALQQRVIERAGKHHPSLTNRNK
ncbi:MULTISPECIES: CNP1-like family protein [unclassified Neisseria]|uniref:CNP1-like family protein n=1 Tax=unclassified Neisseria TaxID=2623750 RepID=UPI0010723C60|nr:MULTISPECIES: CNP1-like family protein [unclassified Neisseria]MBF0803961.1 cryptic protein cnp1 [Neisseria sp. 19428wB4_WF04]TFU43302.1 cryptic protein cnp1 [Neisseria sp. WF04]